MPLDPSSFPHSSKVGGSHAPLCWLPHANHIQTGRRQRRRRGGAWLRLLKSVLLCFVAPFAFLDHINIKRTHTEVLSLALKHPKWPTESYLLVVYNQTPASFRASSNERAAAGVGGTVIAILLPRQPKQGRLRLMSHYLPIKRTSKNV